MNNLTTCEPLGAAGGAKETEAADCSARSSRLRTAPLVLCALACFCLLAVTGKPALARASDDAPDWMRQAAATPVPASASSAPAIVLLDEGTTTVDADGKVVRTERHVVKILTREGVKAARAVEDYTTDTEKVREMEGWLIRPSGSVKHYKKDSVLDEAIVDDDIYSEARKKVIPAADDAEEGSVFGFEFVLESKSVFTQMEWFFQDWYPVVVSKLTLTVPSGWHVNALTFNHDSINAATTGSSYTWELRDLPAISEEPDQPNVTSIAARLAVNYFPPDTGQRFDGKTFSDWSDVSRWLSELADPQAAPDAAITAKAQALTAGSATELDRIKAIGAFVQKIHYIAIQTGEGRGGGYRPHPASMVFSKAYGDCKDKANLMRAMLKAVGIQSYPVTIFLGDPFYVRKQWPSPQQFNHCIIAIKIGADIKASSVIDYPSIGRLLIFDPTDEETPVGELSSYLQGSYALIVAGDAGALVRMPETPPEQNLHLCKVDASLSADGSIAAAVQVKDHGWSAREARAYFHEMPKEDYTKHIERWITRGANGSKVTSIQPVDEMDQHRFDLSLQFDAPSYAQLMQGSLLVFKPSVVHNDDIPSLGAKERKYPVVLDPSAYEDDVKIKLPAGFSVDELPDPVKLETEFGEYSTSYEVKDGTLTFHRKLIVRGGMIATAKYSSLRTFFGRAAAADESPVVLARK